MMRRLPISELNGEYPEAPYVYFAIIGGLALDELWRHPVDGADLGLASLLLFGELCGEAEIAELDVTPRIHQDVVGLDIPVHYVPLVQHSQSSQSLNKDVGAHLLCQVLQGLSVTYIFCEGPSVHELKKHPNLLIEVVDV